MTITINSGITPNSVDIVPLKFPWFIISWTVGNTTLTAIMITTINPMKTPTRFVKPFLLLANIWTTYNKIELGNIKNLPFPIFSKDYSKAYPFL